MNSKHRQCNQDLNKLLSKIKHEINKVSSNAVTKFLKSFKNDLFVFFRWISSSAMAHPLTELPAVIYQPVTKNGKSYRRLNVDPKPTNLCWRNLALCERI